MADSISYENPIWELTPTEINVAYLSLTLTKKEIAARLGMEENTVGTHLTNIFEKLDLSGYPDNEKRLHLVEDFGEDIETIVKEVGENYISEYRKRRRDALKRKSEIQKAKDSARTRADQPQMHSPPPDPQAIPVGPHGTLRQARMNRWILGGLALIGVLLLVDISLRAAQLGRLGEQTTAGPNPTNTLFRPTHPPTSDISTTPEINSTPEFSSTPESTSTPQNTATSAISPTPVMLPIKENFDQEYSDVWTALGNPIIIERTSNSAQGYSGVLTSGDAGLATLMVGNIAWTDLIIALRSSCWDCTANAGDKIIIGVRVKDINNMVALVCIDYGVPCTWTIFEDGVEDPLPASGSMAFDLGLTITVQGNTFTAVGEGKILGRKTNSMILPPKYEGKFDGGGVLIQVSDGREVDYIEIQSFP